MTIKNVNPSSVKPKKKKFAKILFGLLIIGGAGAAYSVAPDFFRRHTVAPDDFPTALVSKRSYPIEVRNVGELEAANSISIATTIRSDQPKIIELIEDGVNVNMGDLLVKIDATPFEKKVEELRSKIQEIEAQVISLEQALAWEKEQAIHEVKASEYDTEVAEMELNKIIHGDGPLEVARLHASMKKAQVKFDELNMYSDDLIALEEQGYLNPAEVRQTRKKLQEEQENFENAQKQYASYVDHVHPMQIKKAESSLKRTKSKEEESIKASKFKVAKAEGAYQQSKQQLIDMQRQLREAYNEVTLTEIRAPSPGMVVLREEYRNSQRRKPRVGDTLVRNQPILDLPDLSVMHVKTKVREIELYKVAIGKQATIEVDAFPNVTFEGKVNFIGILAIADMIRSGDEKNFEVKVTIEGSDARLRPGMTARVIIHADQVKNALSVPIHSVFEVDKKHYVYVVQHNGKYLMQSIKTGLNNEQWVEVLSGLKEYDRIALAMPSEEKIVHMSKAF